MAGNFESFSFPPGAGTSSSNSISRRIKFGQFLESSSPPHHYYYDDDDDEDEEALSSTSSSSSRRRSNDDDYHHRISSSSGPEAGENSPFNHNNYTATSSPWANGQSPYITSPWVAKLVSPDLNNQGHHHVELIGSLVREEGHVYSLAASPRFLYTGSDSKNIRVWSKDRLRDSGGFKSGSGLVKSIIIWPKGHKIFTGHQDGKIRVWRSPESGSSTEQHKRVGSLPTWKDCLRSWLDPSTRRRKEGGEAAVVTVRRNGRKVPRVRHFDAVSCLSLNEEAGILYSASWDKTVKVWRLKDNKCVESIWAHDDAVNAVAVGFDGLVFSGSADGTVKVWRREMDGNTTRHFYVQTLLEQASAVTSLAVSPPAPGGTAATVYAGTSDGLVNFWEYEKQLSYGGVLRGHKLAVLCLSTAGSTLVLSGSADSTICVWRREPGGVHTCLSVLTGHSGPVKCLAVEEDRSTIDDEDNDEEEQDDDDDRDRRWRLYSGSLDKSVKVWVVRA